MRVFLKELLRFPKNGTPSQSKTASLEEKLRAEKASKMLALATSLKEQATLWYSAKISLHAATPQTRRDTQERLDTVASALESARRTFAKALVINKPQFDDELNALLAHYQQALDTSVSKLADIRAMSREIIHQHHALAESIAKIETKVRLLQK